MKQSRAVSLKHYKEMENVNEAFVINNEIPSNIKTESVEPEKFFLEFINLLEGWKTKCKNLHWAAPKKNIHEYLDEFLDILCDFQDTLAESYMGATKQMKSDDVQGVPSDTRNAREFIEEIKTETCKFYEDIPEDTIFVGIKSETETFIKDITKYTYLFSLCDV